jgi:cobalamin-dependent methionine synthase I
MASILMVIGRELQLCFLGPQPRSSALGMCLSAGLNQAPEHMSKPNQMNHHQIKQTLSQMADVLRQCERQEWADRLDAYRARLYADSQATVADIISLYGGMGSINDIVLYKNMQPRMAENQVFDQLRGQLFDLIRPGVQPQP